MTRTTPSGAIPPSHDFGLGTREPTRTEAPARAWLVLDEAGLRIEWERGDAEKREAGR